MPPRVRFAEGVVSACVWKVSGSSFWLLSTGQDPNRKQHCLSAGRRGGKVRSLIRTCYGFSAFTYIHTWIFMNVCTVVYLKSSFACLFLSNIGYPWTKASPQTHEVSHVLLYNITLYRVRGSKQELSPKKTKHWFNFFFSGVALKWASWGLWMKQGFLSTWWAAPPSAPSWELCMLRRRATVAWGSGLVSGLWWVAKNDKLALPKKYLSLPPLNDFCS